jgi:hypothetical protein
MEGMPLGLTVGAHNPLLSVGIIRRIAQVTHITAAPPYSYWRECQTGPICKTLSLPLLYCFTG